MRKSLNRIAAKISNAFLPAGYNYEHNMKKLKPDYFFLKFFIFLAVIIALVYYLLSKLFEMNL